MVVAGQCFCWFLLYWSDFFGSASEARNYLGHCYFLFFFCFFSLWKDCCQLVSWLFPPTVLPGEWAGSLIAWPASSCMCRKDHVSGALSNPSSVSGDESFMKGRFSVLTGCKLFLQSWLFFFFFKLIFAFCLFPTRCLKFAIHRVLFWFSE